MQYETKYTYKWTKQKQWISVKEKLVLIKRNNIKHKPFCVFVSMLKLRTEESSFTSGVVGKALTLIWKRTDLTLESISTSIPWCLPVAISYGEVLHEFF